MLCAGDWVVGGWVSAILRFWGDSAHRLNSVVFWMDGAGFAVVLEADSRTDGYCGFSPTFIAVSSLLMGEHYVRHQALLVPC